MRKSIFVIAALFAATFANAQITLEHTFEGGSLFTHTDGGGISQDQTNRIQAPYFYIWDETSSDVTYSCWLELYDPETLDLYKKIVFEKYTLIHYITKNIFTTDNKVAFIANDKIMNEDKEVVYDFNLGDPYYLRYDLVKFNGNYKLVARTSYGSNGKTYIYSLPGNGEAQAISNPSPKRNARKVAREGQVLVETENSTYTLQGQEVK